MFKLCNSLDAIVEGGKYTKISPVNQAIVFDLFQLLHEHAHQARIKYNEHENWKQRLTYFEQVELELEAKEKEVLYLQAFQHKFMESENKLRDQDKRIQKLEIDQ